MNFKKNKKAKVEKKMPVGFVGVAILALNTVAELIPNCVPSKWAKLKIPSKTRLIIKPKRKPIVNSTNTKVKIDT